MGRLDFSEMLTIHTVVARHHTADEGGELKHVGHSRGVQQLVLQIPTSRGTQWGFTMEAETDITAPPETMGDSHQLVWREGQGMYYINIIDMSNPMQLICSP